tara:strand:+ start:106 stop:954 length:849 start_codon:yes stop_codon:yes gene_type:complete
MSQFKYLSEKILDAEFGDSPFKHVLIEDFLSEEHLQAIINDPQIHWDETASTEELISKLFEKSYVVQKFPGCITDVYEYIKRYKNNDFPTGRKGNPVESFGITFRLQRYQNPFIKDLVNYLNGKEFKAALTTKFNITANTNIITAIQKNLSHYEISPHPDVREKALTYLLNINKNDSVDEAPIHTHLLKFKDEWNFIPEYWKTNPSKNRCWIPWDWCETGKICNKNNSIVLFAPNIDTLHAIRMQYDHNKFQRTQLYGNLMGVGGIVPQMNWKELKAIRDAR